MTRRRHLPGAAVALLAAAQTLADVSLLDAAALEKSLERGAPCCVIDARSAVSRLRAPLADARPYEEDMKIDPTGVVVVIADDDARALEIGARLAAGSGAKDVHAVQGGAATWQTVTAGSAFTRLPRSFVIPSNTCEQGKPLQELRTR